MEDSSNKTIFSHTITKHLMPLGVTLVPLALRYSTRTSLGEEAYEELQSVEGKAEESIS
jgi:predicted CoA-binding protein